MRSNCTPTLAAALLAALGAAPAHSALQVVTTTEDLAALTREVGGDRVEVEAMARGYQDPHYVEAKPSYILKLHRADLLVAVGRELEVAWLPALVQQSRNAEIQVGARGYLDASATVQILDIPTGQITRAMGDVHPLGNPHYLLDPGNGRRVAAAIQQKLTQLDPEGAAGFAARYADFDRRLSAAEARWDELMRPLQGLKVVTYHSSWPNFCRRFGLDVIGFIEPRPGIPPTPRHVLSLVQEIKDQGVKLLIVEPYFDLRTPKAIARESGAQVLVLLPSVGGLDHVKSYVELFDHDITTLVAAAHATGAR